MPKAKAGFFQEHVEKLTLAACGLLVVGSVIFFIVLSPFKSPEGYGPAELCDAAARTADETLQRVRGKKHPPDPGPKNPLTRDLDKVFGRGDDAGLIAMAKIQPKFAPFVQWAPTLVDTGSGESGEKHELARLLPPERPVVRAGRATFLMADPTGIEDPGKKAGGGGGHEVNRAYVYVAAQLDLLAQGALFRRAGYSPGKFDAPLAIMRIHLQRRLAEDENAPWEDIPIYSPFKPIEPPEVRFTPEGRFATADQGEAILNFRKLLLRFSNEIARTPPPDMSGKAPIEIRPRLPWLIEGDPKAEEQFTEETEAAPERGALSRGGRPPPRKVVPVAERRFNKWMSFADQALRLSPPDLDLAAILIEAALGEEGVPPNLHEKAVAKQKDLNDKLKAAKLSPIRAEARRPEKMMPISAMDLDVASGQTYVYRIRYEILNPFVGEPGELKDVADAEKLTLLSDWSPPSARVEIKSDTYFYVTAVNPKARTAEVEIFRQKSKQWYRNAAKIALGEKIGKSQKVRKDTINFDTGTMAVDFLGDGGGALVYVDLADGRLHERTVTRDAADAKHKELMDLVGKTR